uniref:Uncharacterized protein n=1 Tax=Ananas comosus var. bracteatus TaxID=296719 RepID=A0A6V7NLL0_ANACO|nr:unnamed protein product [Ananas comosus var. bracteatus]
MGEVVGEPDRQSSSSSSSSDAGGAAPPRRRPLGVLALIALIFYDVSGAPSGWRTRCAGRGPAPLPAGVRALPGDLVPPGGADHGGAGLVLPGERRVRAVDLVGVRAVLGVPGGVWKWVSGTMDNALYPVLFLDYLRGSLPLFALPPRAPGPRRPHRRAHLPQLPRPPPRRPLRPRPHRLLPLPFVVLALLAAPRLRPARWLAFDPKALDLRTYFNSMFWNLNYWDKASTLAGEVDNPSRSFPRACSGPWGSSSPPTSSRSWPHRRHGRLLAGELDRRLLRRGRHGHRRALAPLLDPARRRHVQHGPLRGRDEQRLLPVARHERDGDAPRRLRPQIEIWNPNF